MGEQEDRSRPRFSEEWLVAVLDSLSEGVIALDTEGKLVAANPAAEEILGFAISEKRYGPWDLLALWSLIDEQEQPLDADTHPVVRSLEDGKPRGPRLFGLRGRGETRWLALATHVLPDEADGRGVVVSFQDVTELIHTERELQRILTLLRDFMSAASHDLRTPLATITGMGDLLREGWSTMSDDERRDGVEVMARQGRHLTRLVDDLSVVARLEGGGVTAKPELVGVRNLVEAALDGIPRRDELRLDVPETLAVWVDPDHGRRMLLNLVQNAIRYGAPPVEVAAAPDGDTVRLTVTDHGPGVPDEFVPKLFERFSRATSNHVGGGAGLGLSIVAGLATINGGTVHYEEDAPDTRFVLRLPAAGGT